MHTTDSRMHLYFSSKIVLTLVDLAEDYDTGEFRLWVVGNLRVEGEDTHAAAILSGNVLVGLLDQHCHGFGVVV